MSQLNYTCLMWEKMAVICVREISLLMYGCYGNMLPWMLVVAMDAHCLLWLCVVEVINTQYRKNKNLTTTQVTDFSPKKVIHKVMPLLYNPKVTSLSQGHIIIPRSHSIFILPKTLKMSISILQQA